MKLEIHIRRSVKKFLQNQKITLTKLSKETGISRSMLSQWLNGKSDMGFDKVCRILDYAKFNWITYMLHKVEINHNWEIIRQKIAVAQGRQPTAAILQEFYIEDEGNYQLDLNETHRHNYQTVGTPQVVGIHMDDIGMRKTTIDPYLVEWIAGSTNLSEHTLKNAHEDDWTLQFFEDE